MQLFFSITICIITASICSAQQNWEKNEQLILNNPPFNECHASTIVALPKDSLMVAFFAGTRESSKDVCIWVTSKQSTTWSKPYIIAEGIINDTVRYPCWNPVLFQSNSGKLFLFYKVGPNPREWWGMVKISLNNGKSWSKAKRLPDGILGPVKNKPVQLKDGTILCPSSVETEKTWRVRMESYSEVKNTWTTSWVDSGSLYKVIQPSILKHPGNKLQLLCRSDQNQIISSWSNDNGKTWGKFCKLNLLNPNSGTDAVTLKSGIHLLVYNPSIRGKDWFNNREQLHVAKSADGINWKDISILDNGTSGSNEEFSYPAIIQSKNGTVHITYTYKGKNIKHVWLKKKSK